MFISRKKELSELTSALSSWDKKTAVLIYGKRRTGKTTLIGEAARFFDGTVINHLCVSSTFEGNLELMGRSVCRALSLPEIQFQTIFDLMDFLKTQDKKILLIIDEYSYLKQTRKQYEVDSIMQGVIDHLPSNVKLILCGSYITMMKELLTESDPLFGRFTLIQHIREFDYFDASCFCNDLSPTEKVAFYAVFGGSPFVLDHLDYHQSLRENIIRLLLPETGLIRSHIENIMLKEIQKAYDTRILEVLGNGKKRYSEIAAALRIRETGLLEKQLKNLLNMETIRKSEPINRTGDAQKRFYEITDNLMRFYFSFIFGSAGSIMRIGADQYYRMMIEDRLRQFISRRLEGIALQYFQRMSGKGVYQDAMDFGSYWYDDPVARKNGEFDCVIKRKNHLFDFYECKYYDHPMTLGECRKEEEQVLRQNGIAVNEIGRIGFVCTGGFDFPDTEKRIGLEESYVLINGDILYKMDV